MSEIELHQPQAIAPVSGTELDTMVRQAELMASSSIIPKDYRKQPANILVAAMTGRTFGWDAMTAMRNGHVIEGTWSIKPEAMLALVRRAGHSVTGETTPAGASVVGRRADTGDEMTVSFTLDDAKRAGLATKSTWKQYPQSMCWARAVSQLCRMLFADVTLGLSYTPEELGAEVDGDGAVVEADARPSLPPATDDPRISPANAEALRQRCAERDLDVAEVVHEGTNARTRDPAEVHKHEVTAIKAVLDTIDEAAARNDQPAPIDGVNVDPETGEVTDDDPAMEPF